MANIIINNKQYNNVPSVSFDKVGGGIATYTENGGSGVTIVQLDVNAAGTYNAPIDTAYNPVVVPSGTEGTPTATKGTVSGNAVTVTPSVTNTGGYISGSTKTGTGVTVSASELVGGTKAITSSGTTDVTNYANASVASGSVVVDNITLDETDLSMSASVNSSGLVTYNVGYQGYIDATVSAGYVSSYTSGGLEITATNTYQLSTQGATTFTPTTTDQTIASGKYLTGAQTIKGDANLIPANIADGVTIFGVTGTHSGGGGMSVVVTQDSHGGDIVTITGEEHRVAPLNDVNFIDYDGTCHYSYAKTEFASLSALPDAPTHDGLTSQGWMYTLAQAKAQASSDGKLYVGHLYSTNDGKTHVKVRLQSGRLSCYLGLFINGTATVDWGDSSTSTVTGSSLNTIVNTPHTWASAGDYDIKIDVPTGSIIRLGGNASYGQLLWVNETSSSTRNKNIVYMSCIREVNIGNNCQIGSSVLNTAYHAKITYPSASSFSSGAFGFGITFYELPILCFPYGLTSLGNYAVNNPSVKAVQIPNTVTSLGTSVFSGCNGLSTVIIPSSVTDIGANCFQNCYGLAEIHFKPATPPTVANSNAWTNLPTDCKIYVPTGRKSAYTSAQDYPSSSTYTYIEE